MSELKGILNALMISSNGQMLSIDDFIRAMPEQEVSNITAALQELVDAGGDSYDIIEIQGNYFARTKQEYVEYVQRLKGVNPDVRVRRALIEILAVIAMRQPVSRSEIEEIRAVQLNISILHDLQDYGWIKVVKVTNNDAHLYGTTLKFLQDFGLSSITELEVALTKIDALKFTVL